MSRSVNPNDMLQGLPSQQMRWAQSLDKVTNGNIDMGSTNGLDSTGTPASFNQGNMKGVLVRIGASGSGNGPKYNWSTSGTGVVIFHGLMKQPIGFHVVDSDKALTVHRTVVADENQITLAPSDATANCTVWIFTSGD